MKYVCRAILIYEKPSFSNLFVVRVYNYDVYTNVNGIRKGRWKWVLMLKGNAFEYVLEYYYVAVYFLMGFATNSFSIEKCNRIVRNKVSAFRINTIMMKPDVRLNEPTMILCRSIATNRGICRCIWDLTYFHTVLIRIQYGIKPP